MTLWDRNCSKNLIIILVFLSCCWFGYSAHGCIEFSRGICVRCDPSSYHLYDGRCYANLIGCLKYQKGSICVECDTTFSILVDGICDYSSAPQTSFIQEKISQVYLYNGIKGEKYGQSNFRPISIEEARAMKTFEILDSFLRTGQYRHRISKTPQPVFSVYTYQRDQRQSFKILYDGTGGAVILSIGDVNTVSLTPTIRSIVVISIHQRIDFCSLYNQRQECERCTDGYHLENGKCYLSIGGCISYKKNICLRCVDYYLLIENRCVADCPSISDCRSAFYYGIGIERSTIQIAYGDTIYNSSSYQALNSQNTGIVIVNKSQKSQVEITPMIETKFTTIVTTTTTSTSVVSDDPNCKDFDERKGGCKKCYPFYFLNEDKKCEAVSPFCQTYSESDGGCLTCYTGFKLEGRQCKFK